MADQPFSNETSLPVILSLNNRFKEALINVVTGVAFNQISLSLPMNDHSAITYYSTIDI